GGAAPTATSGRSGASPTPVSPGTGPDCSQLTHFPQGRDDLSPAHQTLLIAAARRIQAEGIRVVLVTGFASSEGGDADNFVLGQRRADRVARELKTTLDRMRPGSSAGVAMIATSRGESEQTAGGDLALNRRVTLCLQVNRVPPRPRPQPQPVAVETKVFRVVAKSFIDRVGSHIGSLDCGIDIGPITVPGASNLGLRGLAFATDQAFSENPTSDAIFTSPPPESKGYRLFSRGMVSVERRGSEAVSVSLAGGLTTDAGKECVPGTGLCLQAPPLIVDEPFSTRRIDASRIAFRWGVKGRPPSAAEPAFEAICHRDCVFIWHQVKGTIDCSSGTAVITNLVVEGSRFPSHKVWLDGAQGAPVRQGPLSNLWDSAAGDPSRVR
ncbi:MAG: OmpA family protein, partial [Burkholderiaceae bacterium]